MADGTYRFQQPGAGQFFFQTQPQQLAHQRQILRNGTSSPTARLKFNPDTPSPSRSPPLTQAATLNQFAMYGQAHQGQHVMMNGSQAHQRFSMQIPKFQSQAHHAHAQQAHHHAHHNQPLAQHNFSAAALASTTPHFTPNHMQNGIHANLDDDIDEMNEHWQQQLQLAAEARQSSSPHYHARTVAQQAKGIQIQPEVQEFTADGRNGLVKTKPASRQGWHALDFGGQGLRALSTSLFNYTFLEKLYLNHNKLKVLPPAIGKLRKLNQLDLSGNELTDLPEEIGMLSSLKKLYLFDNNIRTLPYEMGYLYRLDTLGIEGNPLDDILKAQVMKEGTKALIRYLKEEMPGWSPFNSLPLCVYLMTLANWFMYKTVHLPPPDRDWIILDETVSSSNTPTEKITVLSYNTLCSTSATQSHYGYAPSRVLSWEFRRELIFNELRSHDSDIVCLQEVDQGSYNGYFREQLAYSGYKGVYWPRGRAMGMQEEEAKNVDGCATFFKEKKFILLDKQMINFGQTAVRRPDAKGQDDIYNRLWQKDHIAVVIFLENRQTGSRFMAVNAHLYWDPAFKDVKLIQTAILMEEITKLSETYAKWPACTDKAAFRFSEAEGESDEPLPEPAPSMEYASGEQIPLLMCGDFNSGPGSAAYNLIANGMLTEEHPDLEKRLYGNLSRVGMTHPFKLKSAYSTVGEMSFTNYTPDFKDILDYIWFSSTSLHVSALLGEVDKEYLKRVPGFPNYHFPSDHVALFAEFSVKGKKGKVVEADFGPQRN